MNAKKKYVYVLSKRIGLAQVDRGFSTLTLLVSNLGMNSKTYREVLNAVSNGKEYSKDNIKIKRLKIEYAE